jgi:transcriptional regulatory protein RtcR
MATLANAGRICEADVAAECERNASGMRAECERMKECWSSTEGRSCDHLKLVMAPERIAELDVFDQVQLAAVIGICRECRSISDAGRQLFSVSRLSKSSPNDADRLRKYLARFGLNWSDIASPSSV